MDRHNMRAQKDNACGIGTKNDEWRFAVDQIFNITYWPYIQVKNTTLEEKKFLAKPENKDKKEFPKDQRYLCIRKFFADSYDSLILEGARFGLIVSSITLVLGVVVISN